MSYNTGYSIHLGSLIRNEMEFVGREERGSKNLDGGKKDFARKRLTTAD